MHFSFNKIIILRKKDLRGKIWEGYQELTFITLEVSHNDLRGKIFLPDGLNFLFLFLLFPICFEENEWKIEKERFGLKFVQVCLEGFFLKLWEQPNFTQF